MQEKEQYFLVPSLKSLTTHKIITWIYSHHHQIDLSKLNHDILEYLATKMPYAVLVCVHELKLYPEFFTDEFLINFTYLKG